MAQQIQFNQGKLIVPDDPIIPFIEGDGIGADITPAMKLVVDHAVKEAFSGQRQIVWKEVLAGEKANAEVGSFLPDDTLDAFREYLVGIKGPLTTPVGGGIRSLNVAIRQVLDLYSCIRPVRWYGSSSPLIHPEYMDIVVIRENTEDVYAGVEYEATSQQAKQLISMLRDLGVDEARIPDESAIGIKPISQYRSKRHIRKALTYAMDKQRKRVTLMHKGNIMKYTEGAFMRWGYEVIKETEFADHFIAYTDLADPSVQESQKVVVDDRIADNMFQQILTRTNEYDVIVTTNLNGDYLSDAAAAGAGGLGMAPGGNVGESIAIFEATHGSAPRYAGLDKVNPCSLILSGAMMLEHLGWHQAAQKIHAAVSSTLRQGIGTYDLIRGWKQDGHGRDNLREISCSAFAQSLCEAM